MSFSDHTIFFPLGRLAPSFVAIYLARWVDVDTGWHAAHWDDDAHTRRRYASLSNGTIAPTPHYDAPVPTDLTPEELVSWKSAHRDGDTISLGWPQTFIDDLLRDPQPEPELFDGVRILSTP